MPALPAALWLLCSVALAGPRGGAWYDNSVLELPTHGEEDREHLARQVAEQLERLELEGAEGGREVTDEELASLPLAALMALQYTSARRYAGAELDVLVPLEGGHQAITVWREGKRRARVAVGPATARIPAPPEAQLTEGLQMVDQGASWTPRELAVVAAAIARVETRAVPVLEGHLMVRRPGRVGRGAAAAHIIEEDLLQFVFHDDTFGSDRFSFVGPADEPLPSSIFVVLHEVAHALAAWPAMELATRIDAAVAEYDAAYARYESEYDVYERAVDAHNAEVSDASRARVEALQPAVEAAGVVAEDLSARIEVMGGQLRDTQRHSPVLAAWERVPGHSPGPTPYSRESTGEAFAESYALFLTDPDALRRALPKVHAWLAAGRHLDAAGL